MDQELHIAIAQRDTTRLRFVCGSTWRKYDVYAYYTPFKSGVVSARHPSIRWEKRLYTQLRPGDEYVPSVSDELRTR